MICSCVECMPPVTPLLFVVVLRWPQPKVLTYAGHVGWRLLCGLLSNPLYSLQGILPGHIELAMVRLGVLLRMSGAT
eukprot:7512235-Ditylum_brightwellii.AAC.1